MSLTVSELCFGRFQKEKLVTVRRLDGSRAQLLLPPLQTPFGPQRGKSQGRWYLDLPLSDADAVRTLTELDAWAATAAQEAWPGCKYIPALKARQHLLPKVRARFSAAGPYGLRCWTPEHEPVCWRDMNLKTSFLTPLLHVRGLWSEADSCGLLLELTDVIVEDRGCPFTGTPCERKNVAEGKTHDGDRD